MNDSRPIGFWLKLVDRLIDEQFASTLEEHGVTRRQWQLLNVLSNGEATVAQLDAAVAPFLSAGIGDSGEPGEPETSAEHLSELIESAWVDATSSGYELTERGTVAFDKLETVVSELRGRLSDGLTAEQYDMTVASLERMARNLGWEG